MHTQASSFETALLSDLAVAIGAGLIEVIPSSEAIISRVSATFPFVGSKIDWRELTCHRHARTEAKNISLDFSNFLVGVCDQVGQEAPAIHIVDGNVVCALRASIWTFQQNLNPILKIPFHHYFFSEDLSWCVALTMEGDMDFGFAPT